MKLYSHKKAQNAAREVLERLPEFITPFSTEATISRIATELISQHGVTETWYYGVYAFVLLGSRSCLSVSGREYKPSDELVGDNNLITVDLSPEIDGCWGDFARSLVVENGACTRTPQNSEFKAGIEAQEALHHQMKRFVTPDTTFEQLFEYGNSLIQKTGFVNLDFLGNLGHSIVANKNERIYIEKGCSQKLSDVSFFTFEPHIKEQGGIWGFKHENIYYFDKYGQVIEL